MNFNKVAKTHDGLPIATRVKGIIKENCTYGELIYDALMYTAPKLDEKLEPEQKVKMFDCAKRIDKYPDSCILTIDELNLINLAVLHKFIPIAAECIITFLKNVEPQDKPPHDTIMVSEVHS